MARVRGGILIVDDDTALVQTLTARLQKAGYGVSGAYDRAEALIQADAVRPSLILCDLSMPVFGTGADVYNDLRRHVRLKEVPIVFMTGLPLDEAKRLVPFQDPKVRLLKKPIHWVMLEQAIEELLGVSKDLSEE